MEDRREKETSTEGVNDRQEEGWGRGWGEENLFPSPIPHRLTDAVAKL